MRRFVLECLDLDPGAAASGHEVVRVYRIISRDEMTPGGRVLARIEEEFTGVRIEHIAGEPWLFGVRIADYGPDSRSEEGA